jgi:hypothetical protein
MAGSYKHVVTDDGNLGSNHFVVDMLETGGDVFETIEEMYGMIWYLAHYLVKPGDGMADEALSTYRKRLKAIVEEARVHHKEGLIIAQEINQIRGEE